ncbi:helix-turn-helix domain-containing protein [Rhizobium sp. CC-YZS058]|uniref:helix-turn-helix domain-containing protein n=1 Tax=Rhizobium sp. CC-YZS058 TaxID=3042153 RepID=UPI002B05A21B|nr:helix-turn-helix domain-containing protein [Rhizobium sp. CC-YZS058]MEA3534264.1 helix-turn-helix domain-containing protein [Rhizobium sp. CC-YZS058]
MEADLNIKDLRDSLSMTQAQLAAELGVDQSTVSLWERGQTKPRGPALKMLAVISRANRSECSLASTEAGE